MTSIAAQILTGRILLVVNPISGRGAAARWGQSVAEKLRRDGASVNLVRTEGPGDARAAASRCSRNVDAILALGGDGTFREVLNGADLQACALGVLPAGAGNVLAGELGMSTSPVAALAQLQAGKIERIDLGTCGDQRFAAVFGAGLDAEVVRCVEENRTDHSRHADYVPHLLRLAAKLPAWHIDIALDGTPWASGMNLAVVGNTANYGGPIQFTPAASTQDGLFDVVAGRWGTPLDLVSPAVALPLHRTHLLENVRYAKAARIEMKAEEKVPCQLDGDFAGWLPASIECVPGGMRMLVPSDFRALQKGGGRKN